MHATERMQLAAALTKGYATAANGLLKLADFGTSQVSCCAFLLFYFFSSTDFGAFHVSVFVCIFIFINVYICMCVCVYVYVCVCIYIYTCIYIYMNSFLDYWLIKGFLKMYVHICTYIYVCICM
jgi:nuclear pore complex protein Nup62